MMAVADIDHVDYGILLCLQQAQGARWKKAIREAFMDQIDYIPGTEGVSVQTIGRRVDELLDRGLVKTKIVSPNINRSHIIGYRLTEDGERAVKEKRQAFLRGKAIRAGELLLGSSDVSRDDDAFPEISKPALIALICDEFAGDGDWQRCREELEGLPEETLIALIAAYYYNERVNEHLPAERIDTVRSALDSLPMLRDGLATPTPLTGLVSAMDGAGVVSSLRLDGTEKITGTISENN